MTTARRRWNMLAEVIVTSRKKTEAINSIDSVRRFASFGLFRINSTDNLADDENKLKALNGHIKLDGDRVISESNGIIEHCSNKHIPCNKDERSNWFQYTIPSLLDQPVYIRHVMQMLSPETLLGFNNTGNVCLWVSEEVMAYYCLKKNELFRNKAVCELGGGMTCLAGIIVAMTGHTKDVLLTDGNEDSVSNLVQIINANRNSMLTESISGRCLRWPTTDIADIKASYDIILCADCLFFDDGREGLVDVMYDLLRPEGEVIIFAPCRGGTLHAFVQLAMRRFSVHIERQYDSHISQLHAEMKDKGLEVYDEDLHYPWLIKMKKESMQ